MFCGFFPSMQISNKVEYSLWALFDLAQNYGKGPIQSEDIAKRQGIPAKYLNQMLIMMRRAGLINSIRGPQGGHLLARTPDQITLLEIVVALEGPLLPSDIARDEPAPTQPEDRELVREVWVKLRGTVEKVLQSTTLSDLCQRKRECKNQLMYYI